MGGTEEGEAPFSIDGQTRKRVLECDGQKQPTWEEVTASRKKVKKFPEMMNNCPTLGEKKMTAHICHLLPRRQKARFRGAKGRIAPPLGNNSLLRGIFGLVSSEDTFFLRRSSGKPFP